MKLVDTIESMKSDDYKERFKAEYWQLKIRYEKLKAFYLKIVVSEQTEKVKEPEHDCPEELLEMQLETMEKYLDILEVRAVYEGISLEG